MFVSGRSTVLLQARVALRGGPELDCLFYYNGGESLGLFRKSNRSRAIKVTFVTLAQFSLLVNYVGSFLDWVFYRRQFGSPVTGAVPAKSCLLAESRCEGQFTILETAPKVRRFRMESR